MKTGMTLQDMAIELKRQNDAKRDFLVSTDVMQMEDDGDRLYIPTVGSMPIRQTAHTQLAAKTQIPTKYYNRLKESAPQLLAQNVNHWLLDKIEEQMVRTLDGDVRAIMSKKYRPLDNWDLAQAALNTITEMNCTVESCQLTERRMYMKVITDRIQREVKVGDVVQAGLILSNSEVGEGSVLISPLVYRKVCSNGMIANDYSLRKYHIGRGFNSEGDGYEFYKDDTQQAADKAFWLKVRDTIRNVFTEDIFNKIVDGMAAGTERKTEDPVRVVTEISKRHDFTTAETNSIMNHLIQGGDITQYGIGNAITRAAQDVESYDRSTELEVIGGHVLLMDGNDWKSLN